MSAVFLILSVCNFDQFLTTPPTPPIADVVYGRPLELFTGQPLPFSWRGPFHFLGNKNSHEFSLFIFLFYQPKSAKLKVDSLLLSCSGREWVNDKRSFDPDIFLLFFSHRLLEFHDRVYWRKIEGVEKSLELQSELSLRLPLLCCVCFEKKKIKGKKKRIGKTLKRLGQPKNWLKRSIIARMLMTLLTLFKVAFTSAAGVI